MLDKRFQKSVCLRHVPGCHENISGFVLFLLVDQAHDDYTVEIFHGNRITAIEHEKDRLAQSQRICVFFMEIGIVCKDIDSISAQASRQIWKEISKRRQFVGGKVHQYHSQIVGENAGSHCFV